MKVPLSSRMQNSGKINRSKKGAASAVPFLVSDACFVNAALRGYSVGFIGADGSLVVVPDGQLDFLRSVPSGTTFDLPEKRLADALPPVCFVHHEQIDIGGAHGCVPTALQQGNKAAAQNFGTLLRQKGQNGEQAKGY